MDDFLLFWPSVRRTVLHTGLDFEIPQCVVSGVFNFPLTTTIDLKFYALLAAPNMKVPWQFYFGSKRRSFLRKFHPENDSIS